MKIAKPALKMGVRTVASFSQSDWHPHSRRWAFWDLGAAAWGPLALSLLEQTTIWGAQPRVMRILACYAQCSVSIPQLGQDGKGSPCLSIALTQGLALATGNWGQGEKHWIPAPPGKKSLWLGAVEKGSLCSWWYQSGVQPPPHWTEGAVLFQMPQTLTVLTEFM